MASMSAIEILDLKFSYSGLTDLVLDIPKLSVPSGQKIFLYGPSGCGKSTLLEIMSGILTADSGILKILNTDLSQVSATFKDQFRSDHIGYIFQSFNLLPYLSVKENILLPLSFSKKRSLKVTNPEYETIQICEKLGISDLLTRPTHQLSIGQQQRVAAARALIGSPEILLADEPTSALDFDHRERFLELLFEFTESKKITLVFVSHDHSLQTKFDRTISLREINKASKIGGLA